LPPQVPSLRIDVANRSPIRETGDYVLYWMIAARRTSWNFGMDRAVEMAQTLDKPLLVLEALRCDYRWASDRFHQFVIQGMADNARRLRRTQAGYYPFLERRIGEGKGLLAALARRACLVVTDDFPCFFLPRMVKRAAAQLPVRLETVDSNGLLPLRVTDRVFKRAVDFRRFLQKTLPHHLEERPHSAPLAEAVLPSPAPLPRSLTERWPVSDVEGLAESPDALVKYLSALPIDHAVPPVEYLGGTAAAEKALRVFLDQRLDRYAAARNAVTERATSELSPYFHFGHLSTHEVFAAIAAREDWNPGHLFHKATAARRGWWGLSEPAESFLDQIITWRELGYNMSWQRHDYEHYESLPEWSRTTLKEHGSDSRNPIYSHAELESAATHDELWNAAQRELVRDGRIHNYLRMLWGKKILEWSATPQDALAVMIELNNKYAIDGRNPNSYSGIFWCLGRYDRAWGPERPIFGKIRYMSSDNTRRKLDARAYLREFGNGQQRLAGF